VKSLQDDMKRLAGTIRKLSHKLGPRDSRQLGEAIYIALKIGAHNLQHPIKSYPQALKDARRFLEPALQADRAAMTRSRKTPHVKIDNIILKHAEAAWLGEPKLKRSAGATKNKIIKTVNLELMKEGLIKKHLGDSAIERRLRYLMKNESAREAARLGITTPDERLSSLFWDH
jgi:hypothetical protein